jgi:T4 superinfection immunity protein
VARSTVRLGRGASNDRRRIALYFLPAINAGVRGHQNSGAIFALNLLLGWTALGWIVALVWSLTAVTRRAPRYRTAGLILRPTHQPKPKPFLPKDWDKPKPAPASTHPMDWIAVGGLAILFVGIIVIAAWLAPKASQVSVSVPESAPGIQYTGSVLEGLTPEQIKKLEAQRDAIPVVQKTESRLRRDPSIAHPISPDLPCSTAACRSNHPG